MQTLRLAKRIWGTGPTRILLLHGLSSNSGGWWRLGHDLSRRGATVVAPDLHGHGATGYPETLALGVAQQVNDLVALGTGWDLALGHSWGGRVLLECQLAQPDFAKRVVLLDPALALNDDAAIRESLEAQYDLDLTPETYGASHPRWKPEDVANKLSALASSGKQVVAPIFETLTDGDHWPRVAGITVPTLIVGADPEQGALVPTAVGEAAAESDNVVYVPVAGAGHSIHREAYDAFFSILMGFMRTTDLEQAR